MTLRRSSHVTVLNAHLSVYNNFNGAQFTKGQVGKQAFEAKRQVL